MTKKKWNWTGLKYFKLNINLNHNIDKWLFSISLLVDNLGVLLKTSVSDKFFINCRSFTNRTPVPVIASDVKIIL